MEPVEVTNDLHGGLVRSARNAVRSAGSGMPNIAPGSHSQPINRLLLNLARGSGASLEICVINCVIRQQWIYTIACKSARYKMYSSTLSRPVHGLSISLLHSWVTASSTAGSRARH